MSKENIHSSTKKLITSKLKELKEGKTKQENAVMRQESNKSVTSSKNTKCTISDSGKKLPTRGIQMNEEGFVLNSIQSRLLSDRKISDVFLQSPKTSTDLTNASVETKEKINLKENRIPNSDFKCRVIKTRNSMTQKVFNFPKENFVSFAKSRNNENTMENLNLNKEQTKQINKEDLIKKKSIIKLSPKENQMLDTSISSAKNSIYSQKEPISRNSIATNFKINFTNIANESLKRSETLHNSFRLNSLPVNENKINLEDLILIEERLSDIMNKLFFSRPVYNECLDWWTHSTFSSIYDQMSNLFILDINAPKLLEWKVLETIGFTLMMESSFDSVLFPLTISNLTKMMYLVHQTFLAICENLLGNIETNNNPWVIVLSKQISKKYIKENKLNFVLAENITKLNSQLLGIIDIYKKNKRNTVFLQYTKTLKNMNFNMLNEILRKKALNMVNSDSTFLSLKGSDHSSVSLPYIQSKSAHKFSLVLDLDETMIHFKDVL